MIRFQLLRKQDFSGVSGTGIIAEGVVFSNGRCAMQWLKSMGIYDNMDELKHIHGHGGSTEVVWIDQETP